MAELVDRPPPILVDHWIHNHGFEPSSSQTYDMEIDTCHILPRPSALLEWSKDWLVQCQDNLTEWYPSGTALSSGHKYTLSQIGTCPDVTLDVARTFNNKSTIKSIGV